MTLEKFCVGSCVGLTVVWCVAVAVVGALKGVDQLALGDLGSYLAGAFSPVAFLWLILGYYLQRKELRLNTEALHLQAEELKNSVEQQKHLVAATRLEAELMTKEFEANRAREKMQAALAVRVVGFVSSPKEDWICASVELRNEGASVTDVRWNSEGGPLMMDVEYPAAHWPANLSRTVGMEYLKSETGEGKIVFDYTDARGERSQSFLYYRIGRSLNFSHSPHFPYTSGLPEFRSSSVGATAA